MQAFLRPRRHPDAPVRLFGFHHAGGSAVSYYRLIQALPPSWDVLFLELPGHGRRRREPLLTRMLDVVDDAVAAIDPLIDRPFAFFGHSMGAALAFEVAHRFGTAGLDPIWLGLSGRVPTYPPALDRLANLDDDALIDWMVAMGGTPASVRQTPELAHRIAHVLAADLTCLRGYDIDLERPLLRCPIGVLGADDDPLAPAGQLAEWAAHTAMTCTVRRYPGHHFSLFDTQLVAYAALITDAVDGSSTGRRLPQPT